MKFSTVNSLLPVFVTLVAANSNRALYRELCPVGSSGTSGTKELSDGRVYEFRCDIGPKATSPSERLTAPSPNACATLCAERGESCKMSTWLYSSNTCNIFGAEAETERVRATVFITVPQQSDSVDPPSPTSCDEVNNALRDCQLSEEELEGELQQCRARNPGNEDQGDCEDIQTRYDQCVESQTQLEGNLERCNDNLAECRSDAESIREGTENLNGLINQCHLEKEACNTELSNCRQNGQSASDSDMQRIFGEMELCPGVHRKQRKVGSTTYTLYCNQGVAPSTRAYKSEDLFFDECLAACSGDTRCQGVNYFPTADRRCVMVQTWNRSPSAIGTKFLIGAIPTRQK